MDLIPAPKKKSIPIGRDTSGIALFMVLAAVSVLAILVSEFTYIAQIGQVIAFGNLDQNKAHYIAKSGLKLSLLRLKAYQKVKAQLAILSGVGGGAGIPGVSKSLIDKIWSFPFFYPIPTNAPGMSASDSEMIKKFQNESNIDGKFSAVIESESSKYNLNLLLPSFAPSIGPSSGPSPSPTQTATIPPQPQATPTAAASFSPEQSRKSLYTYLENIFKRKLETDPDFASSYRDLRLDELWDAIIAWADRSYERRTPNTHDRVQIKRAPFYSVSELHMVPNMDDDLYNLFAPALTASTTTGININTLKEPTLRALVPQMTNEEIKEFFKFRDSEETDNQFKDADAFYKYLQEKVAAFKGNTQTLDTFKKDLVDRNIQLMTEENQFKITVQAQVNNAIRTIEAWVTLEDSSANPSSPNPAPSAVPQGTVPPPLSGPGPTGNTAKGSNAGIKITYMKIH